MSTQLPTSTHRHRSRRFWAEHADAWSASGLSQAEYCRRHGLSLSTFRHWHRKLAKEKLESGTPASSASSKPVSIVPVPLRAPAETSTSCHTPAAPLQVQVGSGYRIEIHDDFAAPVLCKLVRALERLG